MKTELWQNKYGDLIIFVGTEYVIYDKCDRLGAEIIWTYKDKRNKSIEDIKLSYYKNEFRPINRDIKTNSYMCSICEHLGCCGNDDGCCGDDVLNKPCCTCNIGIICPGQKMINNNFKLKTIEEYENISDTRE